MIINDYATGLCIYHIILLIVIWMLTPCKKKNPSTCAVIGINLLYLVSTVSLHHFIVLVPHLISWSFVHYGQVVISCKIYISVSIHYDVHTTKPPNNTFLKTNPCC